MINEIAQFRIIADYGRPQMKDVPTRLHSLFCAANLCISETASPDDYEQLFLHLEKCTNDEFQQHRLPAVLGALSVLFGQTPSSQTALLWRRLPRSIIAEAIRIASLSLPGGFEECWQAVTSLGRMSDALTRRRDGLAMHKRWPDRFWPAFHFTAALPPDKRRLPAILYLVIRYPNYIGHTSTLLCEIPEDVEVHQAVGQAFVSAADTVISDNSLPSSDLWLVARALERLGETSRAISLLEEGLKQTPPRDVRFQFLVALSRLSKHSDREFDELRYLVTAVRIMPEHFSAINIVDRIVHLASKIPGKTKTNDPLFFGEGLSDILVAGHQKDISLKLQQELSVSRYLVEDEKPRPTPILENLAAAGRVQLLPEATQSFKFLPKIGEVPVDTDPWEVLKNLRVGKGFRRPLFYIEKEDVYIKTSAKYSLFFKENSPIIDACTGHASFFSASHFSNHAQEPLPGHYFCLSVPYGHANYSHFLLDRLPLLNWVKKWRYPIKLLVDAESLNFFSPLLQTLGSSAQLFPLERERVYRVESIGMFTMPQHPLQMGSPALIEFLRHLVPTWASRKGNRKVVIHRDRGRRGIQNEEEFYDYMTSLGYEVIKFESISILEQLEIMAECCTVVGVHGAGLSNIAACHPDTTVIEILPNRYYTPAFSIIAQAAGLRYFPYLEVSNENLALATKNQYSDTHISIATWASFLEHTASSAPGWE